MIPNIVSEIRNLDGHWRFVVRPTIYRENKLSLSEAKNLIRKSQVRLRGWPLPYISDDSLTSHNGYVQHYSDSSIFFRRLEFFRLYQSGQFIFMTNLREDSPEVKEKVKLAGKKGLDLTNAVYTITEFFEFTRRMANEGIYGPELEMEIWLCGALDRQVYNSDFNREMWGTPTCREPSIQLSYRFTTDKIVTSSDALAITCLETIFHYFNWDKPPTQILEEDQKKFLQKRT